MTPHRIEYSFFVQKWEHEDKGNIYESQRDQFEENSSSQLRSNFFLGRKINEPQASNKLVNYTQMLGSTKDVILGFANHYCLAEVL